MHHLTKPQVLALLAAAQAKRERDWLLILVTFWHGLRVSEAVALKRDNFHDGFLTVARLKGSLRTTQPLVTHRNRLLDERGGLLAYLRGLHGNEKLFPIKRRQFGRLLESYAKQAGIPRHLAHPHCLKHSIAMQTIQKAGIENVRQYLGHKSISSTGAYLKVDDADASAAIGRAVGGAR
jgi:type 1 fimbriae regulatory protein FimB